MKKISLLLVMLFALPQGLLSGAEVKLAAVFSEHMVLQRDKPLPVWGWHTPGETVKVEFGGQSKSTVADINGKWRVVLDPMSASDDPRELKVNEVTLSDVLVGDVWLCSGQSNMGMSVRESSDAEREIATANHPLLRLFSVASNPTVTPAEDVKGQWGVCTPQLVPSFSAAAYFFGRKIQQELHVPVGLIHSSVGGTPAEAWTRLEALKRVPVLAERAEKEIAQIQEQPEAIKRFPVERAAWEERNGVKPPPFAAHAKGWAEPGLSTGDWKEVTLPMQWGQLGFQSGGVFWVRKEINLPEEAAGKAFVLKLLWMSEQYDTAFWNGVEIGKTVDAPPEFYTSQRAYPVPAELVKAGRNVLAVRIVSATEKAGFWQWGRKLEVPVQNPESINDQWLLKQESTFAPLSAEALANRPKPNALPFRNVSSALYNGMIAPLMPVAIRGAIWYQGESNAGRHAEYRQLLSLLIGDWRAQWGQGDFPFLIQQLANNGAPPKDAQQAQSWPFLREAQAQVAESLPNAGLAIGIEVGSRHTIHPKNKQDIGGRLALVALEKVYGQKVESSGPKYTGMSVEKNAVRIKFSNARGLKTSGGAPKLFSIAGADRKFFWAEARLEGADVLVSHPEVPAPAAVRYGWADNPEGCNLYNDSGLPCAPFRTDDWPPTR